ncbi:MAG: hypothetical protein M3121_05945 [Chloroflexota bacterium]|nr:hypothetical protein [Chloroflexota bacterium]
MSRQSETADLATGDGAASTPPASTAAAPVAPWLGASLPPSPAPGTITGDLASDTDDPVILKQRLTRARERLGFYESFDRIIQENIRRSGELMLEAISFREQALAQESEARESQSARDRRQAEREAQQARILEDLLTDIERSRATLATLSDRVQSALYELRGVPVDTPVAAPKAAPQSQTTSPEPRAVAQPAPSAPVVNEEAVETSNVPEVATPEPEPKPELKQETGSEPEPEPAQIETPDSAAAPAPASEPRTIEVLVHGVPRAAVALSLQRHLGTVADVLAVEAREFAEGVLRLQVTALRPLAETDLTGWRDGAGQTVLRADPTVLELALPAAGDSR